MTAEALTEQIAFGDRYWLTGLLATGGMAEIYLARQDSGDGFDKDVVIKRLKPELASNPQVRAMFLDEAEIGALLNHPHTVHTYDVGEHEGVPFIAMEHICGEELNDLCRRGLAAGAFLPLRYAVELIRQAALSLGHFHSARRADGRELGIVHCDISPSNLMVTRDGFVKVIDFGIARFVGQRYREDYAVPGKLSYMSPEQARRERVDHRSDLFSLGVVLYEITTGQRLFKGPAYEVKQRLMSCEIQPPTFVRRDYPGGLESSVMRALEASPGSRHESAYELADELELFLAESGSPSSAVAIARYLDEVSVAAGGQRRPELMAEVGGDFDDDGDDLDFDRALFEGLAPEPAVASAAAEWDEFEESEQAVADALGIDVSLVRSQTRAPSGSATGAHRGPMSHAEEAALANLPDDPAVAAPSISAPPASHLGAPGAAPAAFTPASVDALSLPSPVGPLLLGIAIGGVIAFLLLQLL